MPVNEKLQDQLKLMGQLNTYDHICIFKMHHFSDYTDDKTSFQFMIKIIISVQAMFMNL